METIKNYLEAMFASLPNTYEVKKAKAELLQMMEDKYNEMIEDGVNENTAIGTVISEFGNLDELADDLGLAKEVEKFHEQDLESTKKHIGLDDAKRYIQTLSKTSLIKSLGIFLLIISHSIIIPFAKENIPHLGVAAMFIIIAAGVGLIIYSSFIKAEWNFISKENFLIDMNTATYLKDQHTNFSSIRSLCVTIGVVLFIVCWIPFLFSFIMGFNYLLMIFIIGIGVFLLVYSASMNKGYEDILKTNKFPYSSGNSSNMDDGDNRPKKVNKNKEAIVSLFWPTITCIYLIISFLTFRWAITWLIWPIAYVVYKGIVLVMADDENFD